MAVRLLLYIGTVVFCYQAVSLATSPQSPCYPHGSIICKVYNHTQLDCSARDLTCIPPLPMTASLTGLTLYSNQLTVIPDDSFNGLHQLLHLNLSQNQISDIYTDSFKGLCQLLELDLSYNRIANLTDTPFQNLTSLHRLNLHGNWIRSLNSTSFSTLTNLEVLTIDLYFMTEYISETPFINLVSLKRLDVMIPAPLVATSKFIYGLTKLETLRVVGSFHINWTDFCSLSSLQTLTLSGDFIDEQDVPSECSAAISLKHIETGIIHTPSSYKYLYEHLLLLTSLTTFVYADDVNSPIQELHSLNSPLQKLTLWFIMPVTLNSSTFESLAKWNASLMVLEIDAIEFRIEDSPFEMFPGLRVLKISCKHEFPQPVQKFSSKTFDGLKNLQELYLNYLQLNVYESSSLDILGTYNSLKVLDLADNNMDDISRDQFCLIPSLERLVLLRNNFDILPAYYDKCTPHLNTFRFGDNSIAVPLYQSLICSICQDLHKLSTLDAIFWNDQLYNCTCPKLVTLNLDRSNLITEFTRNIVMYIPNLQKLQLGKVNINYAPITNIKETLQMFKSHNLQILDLSFNAISTIDTEDAKLLSNLTYLDLRNNLLTSPDYLRNLNALQILLLSGNKIVSISKTFLSNVNHPRLQSIDLNNNPFQCDCGVMALRNWLLTDKVVDLQNYFADATNYCCVTPESKKV